MKWNVECVHEDDWQAGLWYHIYCFFRRWVHTYRAYYEYVNRDAVSVTATCLFLNANSVHSRTSLNDTYGSLSKNKFLATNSNIVADQMNELSEIRECRGLRMESSRWINPNKPCHCWISGSSLGNRGANRPAAWTRAIGRQHVSREQQTTPSFKRPLTSSLSKSSSLSSYHSQHKRCWGQWI